MQSVSPRKCEKEADVCTVLYRLSSIKPCMCTDMRNSIFI